MNRKIKQTALAASMALALSACGGGSTSSTGTDTAGIGGSGFVSTGTITGFGSVYVNGVKFETNDSSFDIEGVNGTQDNLSIGMIVKVYGTINPDGSTGTATNIVFDDEIQGPITGLTHPTVDTATFSVLGTTVIADRSLTYFDDVTFDTLANDQNVEISGFYNASGELHATRVAVKTESEVELKGHITGLTGTSFTLNGIQIDASNATLEDLPNGLVEGLSVEVEGTYNGTSIIADKIESEEFELDDTDEFEVEGYVTDYVDNSNFKVNGISVNASNASLSPSTITLTNDLQVEVEGQIIDNVLIASDISLRGGDIELQAPISAIDVENQTFEITPVSGQPGVTIHVGNETEFEDEVTELESVRLENLSLNSFVEIDGYENGDGSIFGSKVTVIDNEGVVINAPIQSLDEASETVTVLGITFSHNGETSYESEDGSVNGWNTLVTAYTNTPSLWVEIEDGDQSTLADGIADKIEVD